MAVRFIREMQLTAAEFMRQVPSAVAPLTARISDDQVIIPDGDNRVTITLIEEEVKHLGSLDLPMQQVAFEFAGYSEQEMEQFMKTFDERTLRAGGL